MKKTLHFKGWAEKMDLTELLSDCYAADLSFDFDEETTDTIENVFLRFYESDEECSLDDAIKGHLNKMFGKLEATGQDYGYSEYTIEGYTISTLKLGGHDIGNILKSKSKKYIHLLIDKVD